MSNTNKVTLCIVFLVCLQRNQNIILQYVFMLTFKVYAVNKLKVWIKV